MMYKSHVNSHQTHIQRAREGMQKKYHLEQEAPAHIVTQQLGGGGNFLIIIKVPQPLQAP